MIRLLPILVLAGCATAAPVTRIVTLTPSVPASLLHCTAAPAVPDAKTQKTVAVYMVSLWQAGQDCRQHLAAVNTALAK